MRTWQVIAAEEEHTATLIFLHGFGSQGPGRGKLVAVSAHSNPRARVCPTLLRSPFPPSPLPPSSYLPPGHGQETLNIPWCKIVCALAPNRPAAAGQALQSWSSVDLVLREGLGLQEIGSQALSLLQSSVDIFARAASGQVSPGDVLGEVGRQVLDTRRAALTPIKGDSTGPSVFCLPPSFPVTGPRPHQRRARARAEEEPSCARAEKQAVHDAAARLTWSVLHCTLKHPNTLVASRVSVCERGTDEARNVDYIKQLIAAEERAGARP